MTSSKSKALRVAAIAIRVVLGAIFIYSAYAKLKDPWALFAMSIDSYNLLPLKWVEFVARTLPWFELFLGMWLITGTFSRLSTVFSSLLLMVFFALMIRAKMKGQEINCGCFGPGEPISWKTMLRDGSMVAGAIFVTVASFFHGRTASNA
jgi:putative oxidoreductase